MDTLEHLLEVELADVLVESARVGDIVKELTASDHLLYNVGDVLLGAVRLAERSVLLEVMVADDIVVVELRGGLNLLAEQFECFLVEVGVSEVKDLKGVLSAIWGLTNLDLGRETGTEGPAEREVIESG